MLPPDSERAGASSPDAAHVEVLDDALRVSRAALAPQPPRAREGRLAIALGIAFSQTERSPITPTAPRSSGMRATPASMKRARLRAAAVRRRVSCRRRVRAARQHVGERALAVAGDAGDADDLAGAARRSSRARQLALPRRGRAPRAAHPDTRLHAFGSSLGGSIGRPTISSASSAWVVAAESRTRPAGPAQHRHAPATASTSSSLWR